MAEAGRKLTSLEEVRAIETTASLAYLLNFGDNTEIILWVIDEKAKLSQPHFKQNEYLGVKHHLEQCPLCPENENGCAKKAGLERALELMKPYFDSKPEGRAYCYCLTYFSKYEGGSKMSEAVSGKTDEELIKEIDLQVLSEIAMGRMDPVEAVLAGAVAKSEKLSKPVFRETELFALREHLETCPSCPSRAICEGEAFFRQALVKAEEYFNQKQVKIPVAVA